MASGREQTDEYHQQFAERIIRALKEGTAPWQKAWQPGERVLPRNFSSGHGYRGGNALCLAMTALDHGYSDPCWGGWRQIREAGGHVRNGERGTPILYVDWRQRRPACDEHGDPVLDGEGRPKLEWVQRERLLVRLRYVFNVEQTEGLELQSLQIAVPECEGLERAEALMRNSGIRVDHVADDRAYYNFFENRVVLPERSAFPSQAAYTHTALHELGHATGHPSRMNRPTFVNRGGFGSETCAREELRAEIAAMMTGERLGVGHEPRHGIAYVSSWIKALEHDPKEMRAAAVDGQRMSDWLIARDRERTVADDNAQQERTGVAASPPAASRRDMGRPTSVATAARGAPTMSEELRTVLRDMGAAGYRAGYEAATYRMPVDPFQSARVFFPAGTGKDAAFVLEQAHGSAYLRGMHDHQQGFDPAPEGRGASGVQGEAIRRVERELAAVLQKAGAAGYGRGYDDAAAGRASRAPLNPERATDRGPGDAAQSLLDDATAKGYLRGYDDRIRGASCADAAVRQHQVSYVKEVTAVDDRAQAELRYAPRLAAARGPKRPPSVIPGARAASPAEDDAPPPGLGRSSQVFNRAAGGDRQRDVGPGR